MIRAWLAACTIGVAGLVCADPTGIVEGLVQIPPVKGAGEVPSYNVRTKNPILPPEDPRAIVYLERGDGAYPTAPTRDLRIAQQGYQFHPAIAALRVGESVTFPNRDDEFHSVFSYSRPKRFDLGRFRKDEDSPAITFDEPGVVKVYCEIHKHMRATLLVVNTPWFTTTDTTGRFSLHGVPAGVYRLNAFLPTEKTLQSDVTVTPGSKVEVTLAP